MAAVACSGLTLPFAIVAICYKNDRVATDLFHWRKVHFRQIKSPFLPIMVQNLLSSCVGISNIGQTGSLDNYQLPTAEANE